MEDKYKDMYTTLVFVTIKEDLMQVFLDGIKELAVETRKTDLCVSLHWYKKESEAGNEFVVVETYTNEQAYWDHQKTDHFLKFKEAVIDKGAFTGIDIQKHKAIDCDF